MPEPDAERPAKAVLGPAGGVHCSVRERTELAAFDTALAQGKQKLIQPATAKRRLKLVGDTPDTPAVKAGGAPWLSAPYGYWPGKDLAVAVAVTGGYAQDACKAVLKAVRQRSGEGEKN